MRQQQQVSPAALEARLPSLPPPRSLAAALHDDAGPAVIAEVKKASPSAGVIRADFAPVPIAEAYVAAGAAALSVLTDTKFFQGELAFIDAIRPRVEVPILRKDFIIDDYQLLQARVAGADAVLLIVAALERSVLQHLLQRATSLGLQSLVEVHDAGELEQALACGAEIIGINNRNLSTFATDLRVTEQFAVRVPKGKTLVAESGMATADDVLRMYQSGAHAVLIGSYFMRQPDPGAALRALRQQVRACFA